MYELTLSNEIYHDILRPAIGSRKVRTRKVCKMAIIPIIFGVIMAVLILFAHRLIFRILSKFMCTENSPMIDSLQKYYWQIIVIALFLYIVIILYASKVMNRTVFILCLIVALLLSFLTSSLIYIGGRSIPRQPKQARENFFQELPHQDLPPCKM